MTRYLIFLLFLSCTHPPETPKLVAVTSLQTIGDFDGDGQQDTVRSHLFNNATRQSIDSVPNFESTVDYDSLVRYYSSIDAYLILSSHPEDTLYIGMGFGPYCLFSMNDTAVVYCENVPDYSNLNHFEIRNYRDGGWRELANVAIREGAFFFDSAHVGKPFTDIPGFLEKHAGKWVYRDCWSVDSTDEWFPLRLHEITSPHFGVVTHFESRLQASPTRY